MRFLCNIYEPRSPMSVWPRKGKTRVQVYQELLAWIADKHLGDPQPADGLDVKTMRHLGIVGVYAVEPGDNVATFDDRRSAG